MGAHRCGSSCSFPIVRLLIRKDLPALRSSSLSMIDDSNVIESAGSRLLHRPIMRRVKEEEKAEEGSRENLSPVAYICRHVEGTASVKPAECGYALLCEIRGRNARRSNSERQQRSIDFTLHSLRYFKRVKKANAESRHGGIRRPSRGIGKKRGRH